MSWGPGHKWINWGVQLEDLEAHGWPSRHLQTNFRTCWSGNIMMLAFQIVCKQGGSTYSRTAQMSWCLMFIRKRLHETAMSIWNIHIYYGNGYINGYCPMSIKPLPSLTLPCRRFSCLKFHEVNIKIIFYLNDLRRVLLSQHGEQWEHATTLMSTRIPKSIRSKCSKLRIHDI